ncbi:hypothetical protein LRS10_23555 [Phenylobacterium sp. J426]|uniref:hypothetical protein n=1 Tax=Phenylobacterium sp. J426 TaxID=2898439 RepID=UPI002150E6F9|nr:hypothetical protein [Phenylobacterium sp. J426]MCR5876868.1 hypothetical protein [Phenylobacterium sp. J426]
MSAYRLYLVDAAGRFAGSDAFEAENDREAMAWAEAQREGQAAELWQADRQVWIFDGEPAAPSKPFRDAEERKLN